MSTTLLSRAAAPWRDALAGLDRRVYVVVGATLLMVGARMSVFSFLAIYFHAVRGIPLEAVGLAFLLENVARGLASPLLGAASDRVGRKPIMLAGALATAAAVPGFLLVETTAALMAWSLVVGLAQSGVWPAASALLLDLVPPERRQTVLSLNYTAIAAGFTIGVLPAGYLIGLGYPVLAACSFAGLLGVALLVAVGLRRLPAPDRRATSLLTDVAVAPRDPAFVAFALLASVFPLGIGLSVAPLAVYASEAGLSEGQIGVILAVNGPILMALAVPVNARIERLGPYRFLPVAAFFLAASYLVIATQTSLLGLALAVTVFTAGELVFSAALPTAVAQLAPAGLRGAYQGAWALVFSIGIGSALLLTGLLRGALGWPGAWAAWALVTALAGLGLAFARPRLRRLADSRS